jgi:hypothetical protein
VPIIRSLSFTAHAASVHRVVSDSKLLPVLFRFENIMKGNKLKELKVNGNCNFECCIFEALCETWEQSCCCYLVGFIGLPVEWQKMGVRLPERHENFPVSITFSFGTLFKGCLRVKWLQREARHVLWASGKWIPTPWRSGLSLRWVPRQLYISTMNKHQPDAHWS